MLPFGDARFPERFWDKISPIPFPTRGLSGCWLWTGAKTSKGYGSFNLGKGPDGRQDTGIAHKMTWEAVHGLIVQPLVAPRIVVDHLCRERSCCNPDHLEAVLETLNVARGISPSATNKIKVACPRGHAYSSENTVFYKNKRYCKTCRKKEASCLLLNPISPP